MSRTKFNLLNAGVLCEWLSRTASVRLLRRVPLGGIVLLSILGLPVIILSIVVAFLVIIFLVLLMVFGLLFGLLVLRPVLGSRKRPEKVIEVKYDVISGPEDD